MLRYWEQEFPELSPTRRKGGRRYYTRDEVELIRKIMTLLYEQQYTINGARRQLKLKTDPSLPGTDSVKQKIDHSISQLNEVLDILAPD